MLDNVLCIVVDNSPLAGSFFVEPPESLTSDSLTTPGIVRRYSFAPPQRGAPVALTTPAQEAGLYAPGDRVAAAIQVQPLAVGSELRTQASGWWALPDVGPGGSCSSSPGSFALFADAQAPRQCTRPPAPLTAQSCAAFGGARLVSLLTLGRVPSATLAAPLVFNASTFVAVALGDVTVANASTGETRAGSAADAQWGADAWTPSAGAESPCTCAGAVTGVSYRVYHNATPGVIVGVVADVVVTTLQLDAPACGAAPVSLPLTLAVTWLDVAQLPSGAPSSPRLDNSGAPGYVRGAPLLAGLLVTQSGQPPGAELASTDKLAIDRSPPRGARIAPLARLNEGTGFAVAGLTLRGPGPGGACVALDPLTPPGADPAQPVPVAYGEDLALACTLQLDEPALSRLCYAGQSGLVATYAFMGLWPLNASGAALATPPVASHVGAFGNADPAKAWEWVPIEFPPSPLPAPSWDEATGVCRGIPAAVSINFLTARVGEAGNPQVRVVAAVVAYEPDTWVFQREDARNPDAPDDFGVFPPQTFTLTTSVTWTMWDAPTTDYVAPVPPVLPATPADLWYPFAGSGA